jgi:hypothetical protein
VYGYLGVSDSGGLETSTNSEIEGISEEQGPPMNLFSLLKFLSVFIATRKFRQRFLTKDVERLLVTISHLLLDQDRVTLGNLIQSCLMTLVDSFTDEEWKSSCGNIAAHISRSAFCFPSAMWGFHLYKSFFSLILQCETISACGLQADH